MWESSFKKVEPFSKIWDSIQDSRFKYQLIQQSSDLVYYLLLKQLYKKKSPLKAIFVKLHPRIFLKHTYIMI